MENKKHWYDGRFYDKFIAPNQDQVFNEIYKLIEEQSTVLDIGCGTGRLPIKLAGKCSKIVGVDLSIKNISTACENKLKHSLTNVGFIHGSISDIAEDIKFDYAVMTFVLHEMEESLRIETLKRVKEKTNTLIISDYAADSRKISAKMLNEIVEFIAGREHYNNYKNYIKNGGLKSLLRQTGYSFKVISKNIGYASEIIVAQPNG